MATVTIRHLDETTKERIRLRAAQHGRSMEGEIRAILDEVARPVPAPPAAGLGTRIHELLQGMDELPLQEREAGLSAVLGE